MRLVSGVCQERVNKTKRKRKRKKKKKRKRLVSVREEI